MRTRFQSLRLWLMDDSMDRNRTGAAGRRSVMHLRAIILTTLLALTVAGCASVNADNGGPDAASPFAASSREKTQGAIRAVLDGKEAMPSRDELISFYAEREYRPVWTGSYKARARAARVAFTLAHAERQGLRRSDYPDASSRANAHPEPGAEAAHYDLILTRSLLAYAHDVRLGRLAPDAVFHDVKLPARHFDAVAALTAALDDHHFDAFMDSLPPPEAQYQRLVKALAHYRSVEARGGWKHLSARTATRARLARRLADEDPALAKLAHPSDDEVKYALRRFQARHGLKPDGKVGQATLDALNVPVGARVKTIIADLERWRWMPREIPSTYIRVNVPDQSVAFIRNGKVILTSKAVIGRRDNTTPILITHVKAVIANPYWDIPDDISAKALVPRLRRNARYLKTRDMVLVNGPPGDPYGTKVDWRKVTGDVLPYQIRELPGPKNALGKVMLDMPNVFYVYLHDTPAKNLFTLSDRERSHGCVRVEKIDQLAALVLAGSDADPKAALKTAFASGKTQRLALAKPLPVFMDYWTATAHANGTVDFRPDLYRRDKILVARLEGKPRPPPLPSAAPAQTGPGDDADIGP